MLLMITLYSEFGHGVRQIRERVDLKEQEDGQVGAMTECHDARGVGIGCGEGVPPSH